MLYRSREQQGFTTGSLALISFMLKDQPYVNIILGWKTRPIGKLFGLLLKGIQGFHQYSHNYNLCRSYINQEYFNNFIKQIYKIIFKKIVRLILICLITLAIFFYTYIEKKMRLRTPGVWDFHDEASWESHDASSWESHITFEMEGLFIHCY